MNEIEYYFFISVKDQDFVYGFNIISVYNLLKKTKPSTQALNPYTRNPFTKEFIDLIGCMGDVMELEIYGGLLRQILETGADRAAIEEI
jgi:hypothetical protein